MSDVEVSDVLANDSKGRRRKRLIFILSIVLVLVAGFVIYEVVQNRAPDPASQYQTAEVTKGRLEVVVSATGTVDARNKVEVGAEVSGRLVEVLVDFNDHVEPGQVLARIDPTPFELDVAQSQARMQSAKAALLTAQTTEQESRQNLQRFESLAAEGLISRQDLDSSRAAAQRAKASVASAQASVAEAMAAQDAATTRLAKTVIKSTISGIVLDRKVEAGQTVTAGFQTPQLFVLATDLSEMELKAAIDESDVGDIREGQEALFTVDAYQGRKFRSKVLNVRNVAVLTQNVVTYEAILSVDNDDQALRPGMTATATIITAKVEDAVLVPNEALRFKPPKPELAQKSKSSGNPFMMGPRPGMWRGRRGDQRDQGPSVAGSPGEVYRLVDGQPVAVNIIRGETDGDNTVILEGDLKPGELVITDLALKTGAK